MSLLDDTKIDKITKEYLEELGFSTIVSTRTSIVYGLPYMDSGKQYYIYLDFNKNGFLCISVCHVSFVHFEIHTLYKQVLKSPDKYDLDLVLSDIDTKYDYKSKPKSHGFFFNAI
jgi:hypothetical protein